MTITDNQQIKKAVNERYGAIAKEHLRSKPVSIPLIQVNACCAPSTGALSNALEMAVAKGYSAEELAIFPDTVTEVSLGCGSPTALAQIREGDTVLDLGSGGGLDCFLAATRVGAEGHVIGLDMNEDMLSLARSNAKKMGASNVEFRKGEMEAMPVADATVDLIISNCVINLSPDKDAVFNEAFRVLKPSGRLCVSDIVADGEIPEETRNSLEDWASCAAGALEKQEFIHKLEAAGFTDVRVVSQEITRLGTQLRESGWDKGVLLSALITAVKPKV
ncbi:MAG: arsenite methyltransferase [Dehalococcoidia bacterium]|nr:arsenite methyltransferase [Dehalococcoidia bacterium]